jgi:hypothetical protein
MQNCRFLLFFMTAILFLSCKKNSETNNSVTLNAIAVDYLTKQPIPGLKIHAVSGGFKVRIITEPWNILFADTITTSTETIRYISDDSVTTDAQGRFSIQFTPQFLEGMYTTPRFLTKVDTLIRVYPKTYYSISDDTRTDTVFFDKKSILTINMQKSSPAYNNDTVFQSRYFLNYPLNSYLLPTIIKGQIGLTNRTITDEFSYNFYKKADIEWRYYRNGVQNSHRDTVSLHQGINTVNIIY